MEIPMFRGGCPRLFPSVTSSPLVNSNNVSPKSRLVALLLCFFVGFLGVHRFYVGKVGTGLLQIFTLGGFGIWALIDLILIAVGSFNDKEDRVVFRWLEPGSI